MGNTDTDTDHGHDYVAFEGLCPECGQPFCLEYVRQLEETLKVMARAVKALEEACGERDRVIESMRMGQRIRGIMRQG